MRPVRLDPNQPLHFYRGGASIARFRGAPPPPDNRPEDWLASVTTRHGHPGQGPTTLPDGRLLGDAIAADPEAWLGPAHAARFGADPYLLVKLLDAGERLPVHIHPPRPVAARHLGLHHGKTEAWVVLAADGPDAAVWMGFRHDVDPVDLRRWVGDQDTAALLGALHRLAVAPGDSVLVPAGTPHAIGAGMFCVELQEPTDLSIMLETAGLDLGVGRDWHLGLGVDVALGCVRHEAVGPADMDRLWRRAAASSGDGVGGVFDELADPFFRAERVRCGPPAVLPAGYAVLVTVAGSGRLRPARGAELPLAAGETWLVPYATGEVTVSGTVDVIRCLPPRPDDVPVPEGGPDD